MSESVSLPTLGESVTEGMVTRWLKNVGDRVEVNEPLLEVSTDKVDTEIPSPVAGVIEAILVQEDETVEVGTALVMIGDGPGAGEAPEALADPEAPPAPAAHRQSALGAPAAEAAHTLADERGVELAGVGTGVDGRFGNQDIISAKGAPAPTASAAPTRQLLEASPLRGTTVPMTHLRKVVAERAVVSMTSTAQVTTVVEVDMTRVARLRDRVKGDFSAKTGNKLSFLPFFAMAAAEALRAHPIINSTVDGHSIVYPAQENMSVAIDTERGLLAPVIRGAAELDIAGLAAQIADLAERTRNNQLKPDELSGGTFTLTNTGSRGALLDTPIVFLPQSAILGAGMVVKRPVVVSTEDGDVIAVHSMVYLALSYDHRIIDGADAARFLSAVKKHLEEGAFEVHIGI